MSPLRFRSPLMIVVIILAFDCAWVRSVLAGHFSVFGFKTWGHELGAIAMVNALAFVHYRIIAHHEGDRRFLIGFEVGGLVGVIAYIVLARVSPQAMYNWVE